MNKNCKSTIRKVSLIHNHRAYLILKRLKIIKNINNITIHFKNKDKLLEYKFIKMLWQRKKLKIFSFHNINEK
jgi:hypothetical protein